MIWRAVEVILTLLGWVGAYRSGFRDGQHDIAAKVVKSAATRLKG